MSTARGNRWATSVCVAVALLLAGAAPAQTEVANDVGAVVVHVRELLSDDDWRTALDEAEAARRRFPADPNVTVVLAETLFRAGQLSSIAPLLEPLVEPSSDGDTAPPRALIVLARLRAAEGRRSEAAGLIARAVERAPHDRDVLYQAGDLAGSRALAIEWLERYLALSEGDDPDRIEAAKGSVRVLKELGDRRVWVAERTPETLELPLSPLWQGGGVTTGYVVHAQVGPKAKRMKLLLDTGSHGLFVLARTADKRGFEPIAERTVFGGGGDRRHATVRGVFPTFALGGLDYRDALATASRAEMDATGRFHGLLGISIFGGYRVTLDLQDNRLRLAQVAAALDGAPYWWVAGQLLVRVSAWTNSERTGEPRSGLFILDTGASGSVVADSFIQDLDEALLGSAVPLRGYGGAVSARRVRGVRLAYQGLATGDQGLVAVDLSVSSRLGGVEVSGLLGLDVLAGHRIELDTVEQRVRIAR